MSKKSNNREQQYGQDYAITLVKAMSISKMSQNDIKNLVNTSKQPIFEVHHEKIAEIVYNTHPSGIKILNDNCDQIETSPFENTTGIKKFLSSIRLSIAQRKFIVDNLSKAGIEAKNIKDTKSQIYTDIISVLGIFSALIFALFGGVSMVSSVAGMVNKVRISKITFLTSLIALLLIILIFLLLNAISGMVGKQMKVCCNKYNCGHTLFQKYPFFVIGVVVSLFAMFLSAMVILVDSTHIIYNHAYIFSVFLAMMMVALSLVLYMTLFKKNSSSSKDIDKKN